MDKSALIGLKQARQIAHQLKLYAQGHVERDEWHETVEEKKNDDPLYWDNFRCEPDDDVCLEKIWTTLGDIRRYLRTSKQLLQEYYDSCCDTETSSPGQTDELQSS